MYSPGLSTGFTAFARAKLGAPELDGALRVCGGGAGGGGPRLWGHLKGTVLHCGVLKFCGQVGLMTKQRLGISTGFRRYRRSPVWQCRSSPPFRPTPTCVPVLFPHAAGWRHVAASPASTSYNCVSALCVAQCFVSLSRRASEPSTEVSSISRSSHPESRGDAPLWGASNDLDPSRPLGELEHQLHKENFKRFGQSDAAALHSLHTLHAKGTTYSERTT